MKIRLCVTFLVVLSCFFSPLNNVFAAAEWRKGIVTADPHVGKYTSIEVDKVKYRVRKEAKIQNVYIKNGAIYKDYMDISSIKRGNTLYILVKGHWIYQIEKVR